MYCSRDVHQQPRLQCPVPSSELSALSSWFSAYRLLFSVRSALLSITMKGRRPETKIDYVKFVGQSDCACVPLGSLSTKMFETVFPWLLYFRELFAAFVSICVCIRNGSRWYASQSKSQGFCEMVPLTERIEYWICRNKMEVRVDQHDRFMINQAEGFVGGFFKRIFWYAEFLFALGGRWKVCRSFRIDLMNFPIQS